MAGAVALTLSLWAARPIRFTIGLLLILLGLVFYKTRQRNGAAAQTDPRPVPKPREH